jgi:hypothetical protein
LSLKGNARRATVLAERKPLLSTQTRLSAPEPVAVVSDVGQRVERLGRGSPFTSGGDARRERRKRTRFGMKVGLWW